VRFGFPRREDSKVISAKKDVFRNITFNSKVKKVKIEVLSQGKMRLHEHLRPIVFLHSSAKEVPKNAFQAPQIALSF
jgi:predicted RNA-binding protein with PUA domain